LTIQLNAKSKIHAKLVGIESANLVKVVKVKVLDNSFQNKKAGPVMTLPLIFKLGKVSLSERGTTICW
jgi:hypothetical protein